MAQSFPRTISLLPVAAALALSACVTTQAPPPAAAVVPVKPASGRAPPGLVGLDAKHLFDTYGAARLDIRERTVRKLQFGNGRCVLDAYLYAPAAGREPVVTHVDARTPEGIDVDATACAMQLRK